MLAEKTISQLKEGEIFREGTTGTTIDDTQIPQGLTAIETVNMNIKTVMIDGEVMTNNLKYMNEE